MRYTPCFETDPSERPFPQDNLGFGPVPDQIRGGRCVICFLALDPPIPLFPEAELEGFGVAIGIISDLDSGPDFRF